MPAQAQTVYRELLSKYRDQTDVAATALARLGDTDSRSAGEVSRTVWKDLPGNVLASLSPDGRFVTYRNGRDIFVREIATGATRNLTNHPADQAGTAYESFV